MAEQSLPTLLISKVNSTIFRARCGEFATTTCPRSSWWATNVLKPMNNNCSSIKNWSAVFWSISTTAGECTWWRSYLMALAQSQFRLKISSADMYLKRWNQVCLPIQCSRGEGVKPVEDVLKSSLRIDRLNEREYCLEVWSSFYLFVDRLSPFY